MRADQIAMNAPLLFNRPAYLQVFDHLVDRISTGRWKPGKAIPSEADLAREYGVSCGTVRKALTILEQKALITRRQGRGTFVNEPASDVSTIRFIKIHGKDGERIWGEVKSSEIVEAVATEAERNKLSLGIGVKVFRINRTRFDDERPLVLEHSIVPCELFPGLASRNEVLTGIYSIAQQYGHIIGRAEERITAESASVEVADALSIPAGTPVVVMDRIVHNIRGQVVEWRVGWTHLQDLYYRVDL